MAHKVGVDGRACYRPDSIDAQNDSSRVWHIRRAGCIESYEDSLVVTQEAVIYRVGIAEITRDYAVVVDAGRSCECSARRIERDKVSLVISLKTVEHKVDVTVV